MFPKIKRFLLENTTTRQTVAKNTFWLSIAQVGGRVLRAVIIIYGARVLGASEWGMFNYAITLVAFLTLFVDLGISNILTRETARNAERDRRLAVLSTSFAMKAILIAGGVLVVLFAAPLITKIEGAKILFPIVAWILIFDSFREFGFAYLRAMEKMEWEALLSVGMNLAIVALGFAFLAIRTNVVSFTYAYAAGTGVGFFATAIVLREHFRELFRRFDFSLVKSIARSAWPFAISGVLGMLTLNTDVIIIGYLRSANDLGLYSAATRLIQLLYLLPTIISISVLPTFARTARRDDGRMRQIIERIVPMMFLAAIPIVVGGVIVGTPLISFVFGSSYAAGAASLKILFLTLLIDFPAVVYSSAVFSYDRQRDLIWYAAIGGVLNVIFDLLLIPRFGIEGSAVATVLAQFVSNLYLRRTLKRLNPFRILRHLKKVVLAAAAMAVATFALAHTSLHVVGVVALSIPVYFAVLYALREKLLLEIKTTLQPAVSSGPETDESVASAIREETHMRIESD